MQSDDCPESTFDAFDYRHLSVQNNEKRAASILCGFQRVFGWDFGGHIKLLVGELSQQLSQNFFTQTIAISPGSVEKIAAQFYG